MLETTEPHVLSGEKLLRIKKKATRTPSCQTGLKSSEYSIVPIRSSETYCTVGTGILPGKQGSMFTVAPGSFLQCASIDTTCWLDRTRVLLWCASLTASVRCMQEIHFLHAQQKASVMRKDAGWIWQNIAGSLRKVDLVFISSCTAAETRQM